MHNITFTEKEKAKMFDEIAKCYFERNFGSMSKTDMDLLMFHFYMEKMENQSKDKDGFVDYKKCSDYRISKDLGITQQRIRNLKIKNNLVYSGDREDTEWRETFRSLLKYARYNTTEQKVEMSIPDPNLYLEVQNYLEEQYAYVEHTLNSKVLKMRVEFFLQLAIELEPEEKQRDIERRIKKELKKSGKKEDIYHAEHMAESLLKTGLDVTSMVASVVSEGTAEPRLKMVVNNFLASLS